MTTVKWLGNSNFPSVDRLLDDFVGAVTENKHTRLSGLKPAVDLHEDENGYFAVVEVPGLKKEDVKLSFADGVLTVKGNREKPQLQENTNVIHSERRFGEIERHFRISRDIDAEKISAEYEAGILTVALPKAEQAKPREIAIKG